MTKDDAEEYTQALGQIVAGGYRQIALAQRLGVPKALGLSTEQWVQSRLGGYIRMAVPDRREAVKELAAEGLSQREIGSVLGVGKTTVNTDLGPKRPLTNGGTEAKSADAGPKRPQSWDEQWRQKAKKQLATKIGVDHLSTIISILGSDTKTVAQRAEYILDFDHHYFESLGIKITDQTWKNSIETLEECAKQWRKKYARPR